jgi:hypothetical protein
MKRLVLGVVIALSVFAPAAQATLRTIAPPGNSGVQQYLENVPTASGNRPTNSIHVGGAGGGGGHGGGGGGITPSTQRRLTALGAAGANAAALAKATAPRISHRARGRTAKPPRALRAGGGRAAKSPVAAVADTVSGSTSGLGILLPVILLGTLLGSAAIAVVRRHGRR